MLQKDPFVSPPNPKIVPVALPGHAYEVHVGPGLIGALGTHLRAALPRVRRVAIITDRNVASRYLAPAQASLAAAGLSVTPITLAPGEETKSFRVLEQLLDQLLDAQIERSDALVALGGGVIGDLTGLAASLLRRGVQFIQCPTTLLAQVDSSVGGKTGIDTRQGKNLIGSFHQPARVLADIGTLASLPARELKAGYAEVAKYGLIDDAKFFAWCEAHGAALIAGDTALQEEAVIASVRAKARVVVADEREEGPRALLNLGHTFGHALEAAMGYGSALLHGEAVAIGLCMAFAFSVALGLAPPEDELRVSAHLRGVGLPTRPKDIPGFSASTDALIAHMMQDKKKSEGKLALVLARGIGKAFVTRDVDGAALSAFLTRQLQQSA
jgi:3-dehydroquinate synthase